MDAFTNVFNNNNNNNNNSTNSFSLSQRRFKSASSVTTKRYLLASCFLNLGVVSPLSSPFGVTRVTIVTLVVVHTTHLLDGANDDPSLLPLVLVSPIFGGVSSISNFIFCPTFTGAFNASFIHFCMLTGLLRAVPHPSSYLSSYSHPPASSSRRVATLRRS